MDIIDCDDPTKRSRGWVFTINNPTSKINESNMKGYYMVYQKEKGKKKGTPHFQGVIYFKSARMSKQVKKMLPRAYVDVMRGTLEQAEKYCTKEEGRLEGPWFSGEKPKGQGKRVDLDVVKEKLDGGSSEKEIASEHFGTWCRYYRAFNRYSMLTRGQRDFQTETLIYWGPPGSGKSKHAHELGGPEAYWLPRPAPNSAVWFDGYEGQETVIIDEFYGWVSRDLLCRLCDRYPFHVQTKGGAAVFVPKRIIITSNNPPDKWYSKLGLGPLVRRFTEPLGYIFYVGNEKYPTEQSYRDFLEFGDAEPASSAFAPGFRSNSSSSSS